MMVDGGMAYELGAIVKNGSGNPIESRALALADAASLMLATSVNDGRK